MKSKILIFLSIFVCSFSNADLIDKYSQILQNSSYTSDGTLNDTEDSVDPVIKNKNCAALSKFAESAFKSRQNGVKAEQMFSVINTEEPIVKRAMQLIVADTFKYPISYSGKNLDKTASEYASQLYVECMI